MLSESRGIIYRARTLTVGAVRRRIAYVIDFDLPLLRGSGRSSTLFETMISKFAELANISQQLFLNPCLFQNLAFCFYSEVSMQRPHTVLYSRKVKRSGTMVLIQRSTQDVLDRMCHHGRGTRFSVAVFSF